MRSLRTLIFLHSNYDRYGQTTTPERVPENLASSAAAILAAAFPTPITDSPSFWHDGI